MLFGVDGEEEIFYEHELCLGDKEDKASPYILHVISKDILVFLLSVVNCKSCALLTSTLTWLAGSSLS